MSISNIIIKIVAVALIIFGAFVIFATNFNSFDVAFALHFLGGLLLIGTGIIILRGGTITL